MSDERNVDHALRLVLLVLALIPASVATQAPTPPLREEERGVSGYVLAPDGLPVTGGTVLGGATPTSIGSTGRFRFAPRTPGVLEVVVIVPGFPPHHVKVHVPPARSLQLPVIRLSLATYFRARFVSSTGEAILAPRVVRRSLDARGQPIPSEVQGRVADQIDTDGTITIGPLPKGVTSMVLDSAPLARTRLPDVWVMGDTPLIDGGTVIVEPGASLNVDVVDETGAPLRLHDVSVEDATPLSPQGVPPERTNQQGRATFDRLGAGRYRVRTFAKDRCDVRTLLIERTVTVPRAGTAQTRIVAGGTAVLRFTSPLGAVRGASISASPETTASATPSGPPTPSFVSPDGRVVYRPPAVPSSCRGATDGDGRVTLANFPPGPTRIEVRLLNSTWIRTVTVPPEGRELLIEIPNGFLPVRVLEGQGGGRVGGASVTWAAGRMRVEASASASGEALLEGIAVTPGTLQIRSPRHEPKDVKLPEPPDVLYEVTLVRTPLPSNLRVRVVTGASEPLPNAVVEVTPEDPLDVGHVMVTDAKGMVGLADPPSGALRLVAAADGFVAAATRVGEDVTSEVVLTLVRGYRVTTSVEPSTTAGRHLIRIVNVAGASLDRLLDAASDRSINPPNRVSLGPLAPGTYVVELHGPRGQWQAKVRIVDRDVPVTFQ